MKWTKEQQNVIDFRNRDILVSAAAGSGKTAVLVERIIQRITDSRDPIDIDRLLVVTFTKAAAAEMRERIANAIEAACDKDPDNAHIRRQSALIHNAMITTIDSFCLFVVRNHFEEIDLDPNFRIADEGEVRLLEQDVLTAVFEECYEKERPEFTALLDAYAGKRNDQAVRDMVLKIYRMSLSSPWPEEWIHALSSPYRAETVEELFDTEIFKDIVKNVRLLLLDMRAQLQNAFTLAGDEDGPQAYAATIADDLSAFSGVESLEDYTAQQIFFDSLTFGKLPSIRKFTGDTVKKETVMSVRNEVKKEVESLRKKYFSLKPEDLLEQQKRLRPYAEELIRLTLSYTKAMEAAKRKKRILDFSDIEHFALKILVDEETKKPRQTASEFREHFKEIMIDEYQDSNQVQEEIMRAISREPDGGHNLFMVGDVKQSIYRFRLARPELFMEKYGSFSTEESAQQRIDLHKNFRSRAEVVDFCNDIFYKIMSPDLGNVAYDKDAALYCGAEYQENEQMQPELLLLDEKDELLSDTQDLSRGQLEAQMIASKIREMMESLKVTDKESGELRPVRYSDMVILLRSLKDYGTNLVQVLNGAGIPAYVESSTGYFAATEVQTVLAMLRILDNPYQDIPMAAVLHSPMAGLDEEELAEIRVKHPEKSFAEAAYLEMKEAEEGPLFGFYQKYVNLRQQNDLPIHELIQKILEVTGYGNYAAALPAGEKRAANLAMLVEKAIDYEKTSYRGLFHFLRYIDKLQKYEVDFGEADVTGENADVVRVMTIHKSKGLEFPVVFVAGLSRKFNQMDTSDRLVVHPDLGIGTCEITGQPKVRRNSIFRSEIADRIRRENLGEELRVLYVALTRAKEKLILTGVVKDADKTFSGYTGNVLPQKPVSYKQRAGAACYLDWIIPAMLSYPDKYTLQTVKPEKLVLQEIEKEVKEQESCSGLFEKIENAGEQQVKELETMFSYQYPYKSETGRKAKYSVSELKHASMVLQYDKKEGEAETPDFLQEERDIYVPDFARSGVLEEEGIQKSVTVNQGAMRGTAIHRVMECLDFAAILALDRKNDAAVKAFVKRELDRMLAEGELSGEWYDLVIPSMVESFVAGPVAFRMAEAEARGELFRERPFVMQHEDVLVQGIIDVFWLEKDRIILLDYKTDRVKTADELVMRYRTQLDLYADALTRVFSNEKRILKAEEKLIYSFRLKEVVTL